MDTTTERLCMLYIVLLYIVVRGLIRKVRVSSRSSPIHGDRIPALLPIHRDDNRRNIIR